MPTLIIDDNVTNQRILSELTGQWKMKPHVCDSGEYVDWVKQGINSWMTAAAGSTSRSVITSPTILPGLANAPLRCIAEPRATVRPATATIIICAVDSGGEL
jgi:hypothetical protein